MSATSERSGGIRINGPLLNLLTIVAGMIAAYFLTIQSLRVDLADKAEGRVVNTLDKRLNTIEVMLREGVVSRDQFHDFSRNVEARLTRIEMYLAERSGERGGDH